MELTTIHRHVIGLDIHQAQITACAIVEETVRHVSNNCNLVLASRTDARWPSGRHRSSPSRSSWKVRVFIGKALMPHWKLSASFTSRQCTARQACPPSQDRYR